MSLRVLNGTSLGVVSVECAQKRLLFWTIIGFRVLIGYCCYGELLVFFIFNILLLMVLPKRMVCFGAIGGLLPCDLEVTISNSGNSLPACKDKIAYMYPFQTLPGGSLALGCPFNGPSQ